MDLGAPGPQGIITKVKTRETKAEPSRAEQAAHVPVQREYGLADPVTHIQASIRQCKTQSDSFSYQITAENPS